MTGGELPTGDPGRRRLLVLLLADGSESELRRTIEDRPRERLRVRVVAPAQITPLEWLATDEDAARRKADVRALTAEWTLGDRVEVVGEGGDVDPVLAVEDALRNFPADEIVIVGGASRDGGLEASLRRFRLPVTHAAGSPPARPHRRLRETARAIVAGRSAATPFVFFAGVNLFLLVLSAIAAALVLLVLWLH